MRVSRAQAEDNRKRVVDVAGTEFRAHGFDGIGVADLMKAAGLTHGGFYGQFGSKHDLAREAGRAVFAKTTARVRDYPLKPDDPFAAPVRYYLSPGHGDAV